MLTVAEADAVLAAETRPAPVEAVPLERAGGRVLREAVRTDRDLPPFDRATMDGVALAHRAWSGGRRAFALAFVQAAGQPARELGDPSQAACEIMTGAVLPGGADTIVPYEEVQLEHGRCILPGQGIQQGQYIHPRAADRRAGDILLPAGTLLRPPQVAIAASAGCATVSVSAPPSVAVVSVGDELVELGRPLRTCEARPSNAYGVRATLQQIGCANIELALLRDDPHEMERTLGDLLARFDMLVLSGGVSKGKFDHVPAALARLGVRERFHRVRQKPGQPLWFGASERGQPVFALPGNPVATLVCAHRYVLPYVLRGLGAELPPAAVALAADIALDRPLTHFLPVRLRSAPGEPPMAHLLEYHGSGDYAALAESHGFIELPPREQAYPAGAVVRYHAWTL